MEGDACDVAIAGGGPAGTSLALQLAPKGASVQLFEEHPSFGSPSHCAGLVGPGMEHIPTIGQVARECTVNRLRGAVFVSPGGHRFAVEGTPSSALVIDRKTFDRRLGELAALKGATIHLRSKVVRFDGSGIVVRQEGSTRCIGSKVVVGATGSRFALASNFGDETSQVIPGVQFEVADLDLDDDMAYVYFGSEVSESLFGWVIPLNSDTARVGLCSRMGAKARLTKLMETKVREDFGSGKVVEINAGAMVYGLRRRTVLGNMILLGDEALQTKPATGGGIHYSLICSRIASRSILECLEDGVDLSSYESGWRRELEREIRFGLAVRRVYNELSDEELDRLFCAVSGRTKELLTRANFDRHTSIIQAMLGFIPRMIGELGLRRAMHLAGRGLVGP